LRFVCELESLLFDYDNGWGGGSVSLRNMLIATAHQLDLMKGTMQDIQLLRKNVPGRLTRSARMDLLSSSMYDKPPDEAVQEKLRIAKNADYFSGHLNFTKRLCDVAEKLRFMDVERRASALEEELHLLNSSGAMGGDPLNEMRERMIRVVRTPSKEGHVFRSKERTPVLLLMEVIEEGAEIPDESDLLTETAKLDVAESADLSSKDTEEASEQDGYVEGYTSAVPEYELSKPLRTGSTEVDGGENVLQGAMDKPRASPRRKLIEVVQCGAFSGRLTCQILRHQ
jgi:hypothetical protein